MTSPSEPAQSFFHLTPDLLLHVVEEASGMRLTGEFQQLNSYENRVYAFKTEDSHQDTLIGKFYRPGRWSLAEVREELHYLHELEDGGLEVSAPIRLTNGDWISSYKGLHFALFPKIRGRIMDEFKLSDLERIGRRLALLHNIGSRQAAVHRTTFSPLQHVEGYLQSLKAHLPPELERDYHSCAYEIAHLLEEQVNPASFVRIHGDCHRGNILHSDTRGHESNYIFLDFDDFLNGPTLQDFWMLISGDPESEDSEWEALISGYEELRTFPHEDRAFAPLLKSLRIIYYSAWIARRWNDPSFPRLFPNFTGHNYWLQDLEGLNSGLQRFLDGH